MTGLKITVNAWSYLLLFAQPLHWRSVRKYCQKAITRSLLPIADDIVNLLWSTEPELGIYSDIAKDERRAIFTGLSNKWDIIKAVNFDQEAPSHCSRLI